MLRCTAGPALVLIAALFSAAPAAALCDDSGVLDGVQIAELTTPLGPICIELLDAEAPLHVANFLHYIDNQAMVGTFFHRVVPGFIVQGGGFFVGASDYDTIPASNGPVLNEPCTLDITDPLNPGGMICSQRGNERGTVALAKLGGDPNSGTTNWFINLSDNRSNLDNQNGGFTVFGRVVGDGMAVVDAMAALTLATADDLAWMESLFQTQAFPIPLQEAPLDSALDAAGCWNPAAQTSHLDDTMLPSLVGVAPDPSNPTIPFATYSTACATPIADPLTFVGDPNPANPGGCPFDLLSVATTGPQSLGFPGGTASYFVVSCANQTQTIADRDVWQAGFQAHFNQQLVTIDAATVQTTPAPVLPPLAQLALGAGLLAAAGRVSLRRRAGPPAR